LAREFAAPAPQDSAGADAAMKPEGLAGQAGTTCGKDSLRGARADGRIGDQGEDHLGSSPSDRPLKSVNPKMAGVPT
jgi:hypothetical protein